MKKFISILLTLSLICTTSVVSLFFDTSIAKAEDDYEEGEMTYEEWLQYGYPGTTCKWELTGEDEITISGSGYMVDDFSDAGAKYCLQLAPDIKKIIIKDGVERIDGFSPYINLESVEIPDSVTGIDPEAFKGCSKLKEVHIPESVTTIGMSAFEGCSSLTKVNIPKGVTVLEQGVFSKCSSLEKIEIPENTTKILNGAFFGCSSLKEIHIPEKAKELYGAFGNCSSLKRVIIPEGVRQLGGFIGCTSLEYIYIPDSATYINDRCFEGCVNLKAIDLPDNVWHIGKWAFKGSGIEEIYLPTKDRYYGPHLDNGAFAYAENLKKVTFGGAVDLRNGSEFEGCTALEELVFENGLESIGKCSFKGCTSLKEFTVPGTVKKVGYGAFMDCEGLESIVFSPGVKEIDILVLNNCPNLKTIELPDTLSSIYFAAFYGCGSEDVDIIIPEKYGVDRNYLLGIKEEEPEEEPAEEELAEDKPAEETELSGDKDDSDIIGGGSDIIDRSDDVRISDNSESDTNKKDVKAYSYGSESNKPSVQSTIQEKADENGSVSSQPKTQEIKIAKKLSKDQVVYKLSDIKKKNVKIDISAKAKGTITYKVTKGSKYMKVSKTGKVTFKKDVKKGTYKILVTASADGYADSIRTIKIKIK